MDNRYTDEDVRSDPLLLALAEDYALNYQGDFRPLLSARQSMIDNNFLPTGVARMVLNTMRCDGTVAAMLPEPTHAAAPRPPKPEKKKKREPKPEKVRYPFYVRTKWKARWLYSTHERSFLVHHLDPVRSRIRFYPSDGKFHVDYRLLCSAYLTPGLIKASVDLPDMTNRRMCARCTEIKENQA